MSGLPRSTLVAQVAQDPVLASGLPGPVVWERTTSWRQSFAQWGSGSCRRGVGDIVRVGATPTLGWHSREPVLELDRPVQLKDCVGGHEILTGDGQITDR